MTVTPHEARLHIDGGSGKKLPVRVEGYVENGEFHAEAIWLDRVHILQPLSDAFDIIESLKQSVIEALEAEATDALVWEGV